MPIIKGTHSQPSSVAAPEGADVDQPNHSFRYLTLDLAAGSPAVDAGALQPATDPGATIQALKDLADAMFEESDDEVGGSEIPAVYTYWGQFIDHDITAGTDRPSDAGFNLLGSDILDTTFTPQTHVDVEDKIVNLRLPRLDLDSVYGGELGPQSFGVPKEGIYEDDNTRLRVGSNAGPGSPEAPAGGTRDLPRRQEGEPEVTPERVGEARIGDGRNDENLVVAQFHTAFLHFHNQVVQMLQANAAVADDPILAGLDLFGKARQITRWHYQWLVVEDYLKTVAKRSAVNRLLASDSHFFTDRTESFMPLEFSVAAYRFGHTMVRAAYDYNHNFTMHDPRIGDASLDKLFEFTHGGGLGGFGSTLVGVWVIDWDRFVHKDTAVEEQFARKIDTNLALPLKTLRNVQDVAQISRNLARRNLLRGYLFNLPTGQHVAQWLGVPAISDVAPDDKPQVKQVLEDSGLDECTPLWYYILREAEVQEFGECLGEVGSRLVAGTLISMLKADPDSYLNTGWTPAHATAARLPGNVQLRSIHRFLQFAGVAPLVSPTDPSVGGGA